jgi:hypothetical protein
VLLTTRRLVGVLRVLLVVAFAALLMAQLRVLPAMYDDWVRDVAGPAPSAWLLTVAILALLCVQTVVVCTWRLLTMVAEGRIFSDESLVWVNTTIGALVSACLLLTGSLLHVIALGGHPSLAVVLLLVLVAAAVQALLVVVMRALLRQATSFRVELDAVV